MINLIGNEIMRGGQKIGWVDEKHVWAHDGKKVGYFEGKYIYDESTKRVAHVEGDFLYAEGTTKKIPLETVAQDVAGGVIPEVARAAIYILLGS